MGLTQCPFVLGVACGVFGEVELACEHAFTHCLAGLRMARCQGVAIRFQVRVRANFPAEVHLNQTCRSATSTQHRKPRNVPKLAQFDRCGEASKRPACTDFDSRPGRSGECDGMRRSDSQPVRALRVSERLGDIAMPWHVSLTCGDDEEAAGQ